MSHVSGKQGWRSKDHQFFRSTIQHPATDCIFFGPNCLFHSAVDGSGSDQPSGNFLRWSTLVYSSVGAAWSGAVWSAKLRANCKRRAKIQDWPCHCEPKTLRSKSDGIKLKQQLYCNADDQSVIKKLLPNSVGNFADLLPILDIGEAIAVGDVSLLPSQILIDKPKQKPNSATVKFWDE